MKKEEKEQLEGEKRKEATLLGELGVSLLMSNRYLYMRNTDCPKPQFLGLRKDAGNLVQLSL